MQATHRPWRQTRLAPQDVPSDWFVLPSVQTALAPSHDSVPLWQGLAGAHAWPGAQA